MGQEHFRKHQRWGNIHFHLQLSSQLNNLSYHFAHVKQTALYMGAALSERFSQPS